MSSMPGVSTPTPRVLLVDDELGILEVLCVALELRGFEVSPYLDGPAALEALAQMSTPPDLVILDVVMPGLSGQAVFRAMRARWDVPVLFHSGYRGIDTLAAELREPRTGFLQKPWTLQQLNAAVDALLKPIGE
jgi:two-component system cell cycle sensor histidine kinase/response regulator CckA